MDKETEPRQDEAIQQAFDAIYDEAEKILKYDPPQYVVEKLEIIMSIARYQIDVRTQDEKDGF